MAKSKPLKGKVDKQKDPEGEYEVTDGSKDPKKKKKKKSMLDDLSDSLFGELKKGPKKKKSKAEEDDEFAGEISKAKKKRSQLKVSK